MQNDSNQGYSFKTFLFIGLAIFSGGIAAYFLNSSEQATISNQIDKLEKPIVESENSSISEVNGQTVNFISFDNGHLRNKGRKEWVEEGEDLKMRFMFKEEKRDESSLYLFDKSRNIHLRVDLSSKKIMQQKGDEPERELYKIEEALTTPKGKQVKKVVYVYSENVSGSFANVPGTKVWLEDNPESQKRGAPIQLKEIDRDEWSVYLRYKEGNDIQLDLNEKKVKIKAQGKRYSNLYEITKGI